MRVSCFLLWFLMERRASTNSKMSFINGGLSEKTVIFGCNNNKINNDLRERRDQTAATSFPSNYLNTSDRSSHHNFLGARCTIVDDSSELSIFDAKKYFNEVSANNSNNINKVSPITNSESMPMSMSVMSQDQDSDQDSELSRSKPWTGGGVTMTQTEATVSKFSPSPGSVDGYRRSYRARSFHSATPTASSEASWNSQTGLLSNPPGAISVSVLRGGADHHSERKTRKPPSSSVAGRWIFRSSRCPCSGKKSVQVQESKVVLDPKTSPPYINNNNNNTIGDDHSLSQVESPPSEKTSGGNTMLENEVVWSTQRRFPPNLLLQGPTTQRVIASTGFTFPILKNNPNNNNKGNFPIRPINKVLIEDPPRDSLEVFKPSAARDGGNNGNGGLKSRILASVAASGGNATVITDIDDVASDASSDLFEIESFSTQTASTTTTTVTYPAMFHRRDSMEQLEARRLGLVAAASTRHSIDEPMTPSTDWYEPSEASIDWSVTTAEGFDRASIANMSEAEEPWMEKNNNSNSNNTTITTTNNNNRRRSSSGNGLLSCRSEKAVSVGPQPVMKHVGSRPPLGKKPPLARSTSARNSLTFAA